MELGVREDYLFYKQQWEYYISQAKKAKHKGFSNMQQDFKLKAKEYKAKMDDCKQALNTIFKP
jgi:hypothetical protein